MASASSPNSGNAYSGPVCTGASVSTEALCSAGTCTPSSSMSWLPVPCRPITCHVSWIVNSLAGGEEQPRRAVDEAAAHQPVGVPAAARERPPAAHAEPAVLGDGASLRREHPGDDRPRAAEDLARGVLGQVAGDQPAGRPDGDAPAAAASASASACTAPVSTEGCASRPPAAAGTHRPNSPASRSAATSGSGRRRSSSACRASPAARSRAAASVSSIRRSLAVLLAGRHRLEGLGAGAVHERDRVAEDVVLRVEVRHPERARDLVRPAGPCRSPCS